MRKIYSCAIALLAFLYSCQSNQPSSEKTIDSLSAPTVSNTVPIVQDSTVDSQGPVMVMLDYKKIAQHGLTGGTVIDVLAKEEEHLKTVADYEKLIVGMKGKDTIYLKDVATFKNSD